MSVVVLGGILWEEKISGIIGCLLEPMGAAQVSVGSQ